MRLVLENKDGKAVRAFNVAADEAIVISRRDTKRVEVVTTLASLEARKVKFERLGDVTKSALEKAPLSVGTGRLRLVETKVGETIRNQLTDKEDSKAFARSLLGVAVFMILFLLFVLLRPQNTAKIEQELKQQVVQIVKKIPVKQTTAPVPQAKETKTAEQKVTPKHVTKTASIKRMGALSVLGSMKNGKQKGGLNLGAVNTSAGPGLGGNAGSGGMQTTLYGKGLVAAPLGAGSNMQGGGGYGTKGKGGGQAGYGKLSLVGSAGTSSIPLGSEALVEGGLDRDLIAEVIKRNMGQIRFCYEQGLQGDPSLAGRVAVRWVIGGNGQVKSAGIDNTTLNSKQIEDCILMRLRSWKFPLPEGGVDVKVVYPFLLRRTGQG